MVGYLGLGFFIALMQSLSGAGDTMPTMIVSLVTMWLVTMPMAYFLPRVTDLGAFGVRWAMASAMVIQAFFYTVYFRSGRWKRKAI